MGGNVYPTCVLPRGTMSMQRTAREASPQNPHPVAGRQERPPKPAQAEYPAARRPATQSTNPLRPAFRLPWRHVGLARREHCGNAASREPLVSPQVFIFCSSSSPINRYNYLFAGRYCPARTGSAFCWPILPCADRIGLASFHRTAAPQAGHRAGCGF